MTNHMTNHSNIDKNIIRILKKTKGPVHTKILADELSLSWNTVQVHAFKLLSEGKIKGKRIGKVNLWWI